MIACWGDHPTEVAAELGTVLCTDCLEIGQRDVRALLYDYIDTAQALAPGSSAGGPRVSGTGSAPVPLNLTADELMHAIHHHTTTWAQIVRAQLGLADVAEIGVRPGWAVQRAVDVLAPRVRMIAALGPQPVFPDGPEAEPDDVTGFTALYMLRQLHQRAGALLGQVRRTFRVPGYCSACGCPALRHEDGADVVTCSMCLAWLSYDEYLAGAELLGAAA
jgi:hypothetical protein